MAKLNDLLGRALAVPGVRAVTLAGREGLLIASAGRGTERLFEALAALGANALNLADALGQEIGQGLVIGVILEYERGMVSVTPYGEYAAVVTFVEPGWVTPGPTRHRTGCPDDAGPVLAACPARQACRFRRKATFRLPCP
jgi:predicted regulator of Ras-like GTPase activity (Roadblock/LC7/MglB family)